MKVKSESEVVQSCPTLRDPMDCSLPGSSVHRIFQARVLEWVAIAFSARYSWAIKKGETQGGGKGNPQANREAVIQIVKREEGLKAGWTMRRNPIPERGESLLPPPSNLPLSQPLPSPCLLAPCPQRKLLESLLQALAVVYTQKRDNDSGVWSSPTVRGGRWIALGQQHRTEMTQTLEPSWLGRPSERLLTSVCLKLSSINRDTSCSFTRCPKVWTRQGLILNRALHTISTALKLPQLQLTCGELLTLIYTVIWWVQWVPLGLIHSASKPVLPLKARCYARKQSGSKGHGSVLLGPTGTSGAPAVCWGKQPLLLSWDP